MIAAVNGYAIGGEHVLHVLCDLTIAADTRSSARPVRASVRSTPALAPPTSPASSGRSAREIWFLCRRYDADTAERWGLVNRVVPAAGLRAEVRR